MALVIGRLNTMYKQVETETGRPEAERDTQEDRSVKFAATLDTIQRDTVEKQGYKYQGIDDAIKYGKIDAITLAKAGKLSMDQYYEDGEKRMQDEYATKLDQATKKSEERELIASKVVESAQNIDPREVRKLDAKAAADHGKDEVSLTAKGVSHAVVADVSKEAGVPRTSMDTATLRGQSPEASKQYDDNERGRTKPSPVAEKKSLLDKARDMAQQGLESVKEKMGFTH